SLSLSLSLCLSQSYIAGRPLIHPQIASPSPPLPHPASVSTKSHHRRCRLYTSPHGRTLVIDPTDLVAALVHLFTGATRLLPSLPAFFAETDDLARAHRAQIMQPSPAACAHGQVS
ncbi:unnamed protein product, partial [Urochloa humidicola]